jgi:hypothetical protein
MFLRYLRVLALAAALPASMFAPRADATGESAPLSTRVTVGQNQIWRSQAARVLAARSDANSLVAAAALRFAGSGSKPKVKTGAPDAAVSSVDLIARAAELAPQSAAIAWLRLQMCAETPSCNSRDVATVMRWIDADNSAAWMPILTVAQKDRDTTEVDRVLDDMAQGSRFDLYFNRVAVVIYDVLKTERRALPVGYAASDWARFTEASGIAAAETTPSFTALIDACRELAAAPERRDVCLKLAKTMQKGDTVAAQLVGFGIERRLLAPDSREAHVVAERKHLLEWRAAAAAQFDLPLMPWSKNTNSRARLDQMRLRQREEDVCLAILRDHKAATEPAEEHR